ncbi:hypothetical protein C2E20_8858 [Micractinium conductrix]|uniref:Nucleoplasmin-like domain-containing protein n=1 Tax=Micractinium conductrix TaxID=554055 RepID=A0A2P6V045_9CHLO|nr:hypothetical protein C2E20_8858 [Micractinium conductrix]|eukprot:PSC67465.1 hypothetical protein C2E20_8858 [Micractinium conductrix]
MDARFYGLLVPPGKPIVVEAEFDEDMGETLHLTQVALGDKPKPGPHVVFVGNSEGKRFAIGTLEAGRCNQFTCDLTFAMDKVTLSHSGGSDVHFTGYRVEHLLPGSEDEDGYYMGSDEEGSEEEEESSDDEEAPDAVPFKGLAKKPVKPRARQLIDDEAEETSEEEEEDGEMEDDESEEEDKSEEEEKAAVGERVVKITGGPLSAYVDSSEEESLSSGEEDESEEEEEEKPAPVQLTKKQLTLQRLEQQFAAKTPQAAKPAAAQQQQQQAKAAAKRPAEQPAAAKTPQPAKKAKGEQPQKAPATAPAKVAPAGMATTGSDKEYLAALKAALKQGPLKLAALGSKVKRPAGVPKVKHFLDKHPGVFKYNKDTDEVSLS